MNGWWREINICTLFPLLSYVWFQFAAVLRMKSWQRQTLTSVHCRPRSTVNSYENYLGADLHSAALQCLTTPLFSSLNNALLRLGNTECDLVGQISGDWEGNHINPDEHRKCQQKGAGLRINKNVAPVEVQANTPDKKRCIRHQKSLELKLIEIIFIQCQ